MTFFSPVITSSGPRDAKIVFLGEAPGETEEQLGSPFVGTSGQELMLMAKEAGIEWREVYKTNVFWSRPQSNKIDNFLVPRKEGLSALPAINKGRYLHPSLLPELYRLKTELEEIKPNLVVALGNVACWALLHTTGITKIRGAVAESTVIPGLKVLPTFHPANVMRQWDNRPIVVADLMKAKFEATFPEIRRPERVITISPSIEEVERFCYSAYLCSTIAVDVETKNRQITMVGLAVSPQRSMVIPFIDYSKPGNNYWESKELEVRAWRAIRFLLCTPDGPKKVFQNGLYDVQYFWQYGMPVMIDDDTMILHHALFPELPKSLGFMGSIYTNEASWKLMRRRSEDDMNKRDE